MAFAIWHSLCSGKKSSLRSGARGPVCRLQGTRRQAGSEPPGSELPLLRRREALRALVAAAAAAVSSQAGPGTRVGAACALETTKPVQAHEAIFDTAVGSFLPPCVDRLFASRADLLDSRVIAVGEIHTHPLHHRLQLDVIRALYALNEAQNAASSRGRHLVIGFEHFYRSHQTALDDFVRGDIGVDQLRVLTNWDFTFGYDLSLWYPIFNFARAHGIRMIGLNAPRELVSMVSQMGLANLPRSLHKILPDIDLSNERHYARFRESVERTHGDRDADAIARFYESFALWDEFMADSAASFMDKYPESRMVVLAGVGHIEDRNGVPDRITKRTGMDSFTIVPESVAWTDDNLPNIVAPRPRETGDWIWYTQREVDLV